MFLWESTMKKLAIGLFAVLAAVAVSAAIVPLQQASAQQSNTVRAMQSNSFSVDVTQGITQNGATNGVGSASNGGGTVTNTASQGFCLQANQQNAAAGDDATNVGVNAIIATGGSSVNC
jgi:hypothetical protein